jgi:predicted nuclease with TOPRIM domain
MAENPLLKVARLVGGVAMMQGRLGHQVLGQMLIAGSSELAVAGAAIAVAGTARVRNPAAQVVIRTAAPAIAIHALFDQRERVLRYRERALAKIDFALERQNGALKRDLAALRSKYDATRAASAKALKRVRSQKAFLKDEKAVLESNNSVLESEKADLQNETRVLQSRYGDLEREKTVLERHRAFLEGGKVVLESENAILRHDLAALKKDNADLWKKCNLASDGHDAFAEALKRLRREKAILREDHALCVIDKSILRRRNESLRQELIAVTAKLRAALERKPEKPEQ